MAIEKEIRKILKREHPNAVSIELNEWGNWDVTCCDGYEEEIYTYSYSNSWLHYIGVTRVEI